MESFPFSQSFKERSGCYSLCHRRLRHRPMHLLSYGVRLRAYARGMGWLWVGLHFGIAASHIAGRGFLHPYANLVGIPVRASTGPSYTWLSSLLQAASATLLPFRVNAGRVLTASP